MVLFDLLVAERESNLILGSNEIGPTEKKMLFHEHPTCLRQ
jgi:hypothetical protein